MESLVNLEELWLGKNKITKVEVQINLCVVCCGYLNGTESRDNEEAEDPFFAVQQNHLPGKFGRIR